MGFNFAKIDKNSQKISLIKYKTTMMQRFKYKIPHPTPIKTSGCISLIFTSLISTSALAVTPIDTVKEQQYNWQDSLNQQRLDTLINAQSAQSDASQTAPSEDNNAIQPKPIQPKPIQPEPTQQAVSDSMLAQPECLPFAQIQLVGMEDLNASTKTSLLHQAQSLQSESCITVDAANQLARQVTQAYVDEGYFKVNIASTTVSHDGSTHDGSTHDGLTAIVEWYVSPAKVVAIDSQIELPINRLFGDIIDKPANIAWLDQAVSNAERLIDGQLLLDIYPAGDDVRIELTQQGEIDPVSADIEWYYDPDDSYGHHKIRLHSTLRNIAGQADLTSISIEQGLTDSYGYDEDNQQRSASIYTVIPSGRWQLSALLAGSENERTTVLPNSVLTQTGDSWQANIRGDYTLSRDQNSITTAYGQLAHIEVTSAVLGSQLDNQSPTISSGRVGVTHTKLFTNPSGKGFVGGTTGAMVLDLSAEKAFGNHDNPATEAGLSDDYLRWLFTGYLTHSHPLKSSANLQFTHELQGQYSDDTLFGINKQSLGSRYTGVRGLANEYSAADKGISLRNTMSLSVPITSWPSLGRQRLYWSPYIGVDFGVVKDNTASVISSGNSASDSASERAGSGTIGIKLSGYDVTPKNVSKSWDMDIGISRPWVDYNQSTNTQSDEDRWRDTEISAAWKWFF